MRIGIDFDNTLAQYDQTFTRLAQEWQLIGVYEHETKQGLRDRVRNKKDGELLWQRMQGEVYGPRMQEAEQFSGVDPFLRHCAAVPWIEVFIVSHKTVRGHFDETHTNLHQAARLWMRNQGFFDPMKYAIPEDHVYFEASQQEKVARIATLQCDVFIDDLKEIFTLPRFPPEIKKILFSNPKPLGSIAQVDCICAHWSEIEAVIFGN